MRITVFGTGYVGLVQGAVLAEVGHDVLCVDVDAAKIEGLKAGRIPIYEPGLEDVVKKNHAEGRLVFTTDAAAGVAHGRILFIAVGTPPDEDGSADLRYVLGVAGTIAEAMEDAQGDRHQVDRAGGHRRQGRGAGHGGARGAPARRSFLRGGVEPGVSQGRCCGRRLHGARTAS